MKDRIIEIVELGQFKSLIQRENSPITELIKTDSLIEELNEQLRIGAVSGMLPIFKCKCGYETSDSVGWCVHADCCNGNDR